MKSQISRQKKLVFSLITFLLVFGFLNSVAWIVCPNNSVFWENPLMVMYPVNEFDENITIEHYNYNDDPNRAVRYVADAGRWYRLDSEPLIPDNGQLILHFGDSSTWGWGLQDRNNAYPVALAKLLSDKIHSINLGVPGYTSLQGLRYLQQLLPKYHQRIVGITLYFGNNDATENGLSDIDKLTKKTSALVKAIRWFPLFRVIYDQVARIGQKNNQEPRVSPKDYEANMRKMIAIAQSYNIPVVVIEPLRHLSWQPGYLTHLTSLQSHIQNSWVAKELEKASRFYATGLCWIAQKNDEYADSLQSALNHDWVIPRIKTAWLNQLANISKIQGISYIRLNEPFIEAEYPYTFVDYCHPSVRAHTKIARYIKSALGYN